MHHSALGCATWVMHRNGDCYAKKPETSALFAKKGEISSTNLKQMLNTAIATTAILKNNGRSEKCTWQVVYIRPALNCIHLTQRRSVFLGVITNTYFPEFVEVHGWYSKGHETASVSTPTKTKKNSEVQTIFLPGSFFAPELYC